MALSNNMKNNKKSFEINVLLQFQGLAKAYLRCFGGLTSRKTNSFCMFSHLYSVIEVASGEYGDLSPVLFEAVQGGLCPLEKTKYCEKNKPSSSCFAKYAKVSKKSLKYCVSSLSNQTCTLYIIL